MEKEKKKVYFDRKSQNAKKMIAEIDYTEETPFEKKADMLWLRHGYRRRYDKIEPFQLFNHIPNEGLMTRKGDLTETISDYAARQHDKSFSPKEFYQETYRLFDPHERELFLKQLPEKDSEENLWIMKPSTLSKGIGVKILWEFDELRKELENSKKMTIECDGEELEYIIQRYIKDVLLLEERKSEIRIYWMIASVDPYRVLIFPEGTVRLTREKFKLGDYDNPLIHVTNLYQQSKGDDFDSDVILKWDFPMLQEYVHKELGYPNPNWLEEELKPKLKKAVAFVANAIKDKMLERIPEQGICFGLYGADFILDKNLNPWLAEMQKGPGLSFSDSIKKHLIPFIVQEAVDIAFEVQKKVKAKEELENFTSVNRFEWIIAK